MAECIDGLVLWVKIWYTLVVVTNIYGVTHTSLKAATEI